MRRYAIILSRRQRNTITLKQLFNEWLPIHSQTISNSAVKSYYQILSDSAQSKA